MCRYAESAITWLYVNLMIFKTAFDSSIEISIISGNATLEIYELDQKAPLISMIYIYIDYISVVLLLISTFQIIFAY